MLSAILLGRAGSAMADTDDAKVNIDNFVFARAE